MLGSAALCPSAPLLVPELGRGHPALPELRRAAADAVAAMLDVDPDVVAVVGPAPRTAPWPADAAVDFGPFRGEATTSGPALPLSLALGATLLRDAGHAGDVRYHGVAPEATTGTCVDLGQSLTAGTGTVALLVVADGSARRSLNAPGWFDVRAAAFDASAERAVRSGDLDALLDLDADLASALQATGRSSWQVLAGAADGSTCTSRLGYADAPFGVGYLVAALHFSP
jgi:hypothetical protein